MDEKLQREKQGILMQKENVEESIISKQHDGHIHGRSSAEEVMELAAMAIKLNLRLRSSDMPPNMQQHALRFTRSFLDSSPKTTTPPNPSHLARALKKEFDSLYGQAWHCVVGKSFGSFVTHSPGGFIYFSIDSLSVLLFKTQVQLLIEPKLP